MKINKYFPFFVLYFFFNSLYLPIGLLYTTVLTPLFYLWLRTKQERNIIFKFLLVLAPFSLVHLVNGVEEVIYLKSFLLLFSTYIFTYSLYKLLKKVDYLHTWFRKITFINALFTLAGIIVIFTPYERSLWTIQNLSMGVNNFPRLSLLTYEPSYYSTLLVPIISYFFLDTIIYKKRASLICLLLLLVSLAFSFSLGVISCLILSVLIVSLVNANALSMKKRYIKPLLYIMALGIVGCTIWFIVDSDNALVVRVVNVINGDDASGRGRTSEAFKLSYQIAQKKSLLWGSGLGQIKIIGEEVIRPFYNYAKDDVKIVTIPCAAAETLAIFGLIGLAIRLFLQVYLFFKTKVLQSPYRTVLFFYIFIYQFTGSFIMNVAEYVIWTLAFVPCFIQFESSRKPAVIGATS